MISDLTARLMEGDYGRQLTEQEILDDELEAGFDFESDDYLRGQVASALAIFRRCEMRCVACGGVTGYCVGPAMACNCDESPKSPEATPPVVGALPIVDAWRDCKTEIVWELSILEATFGEQAMSMAQRHIRDAMLAFEGAIQAGNSANPTTCSQEVVTGEDARQIIAELENPSPPTQELIDLMRPKESK